MAESDVVGLFFKDQEAGYFVEVGANDPVRSSQTWHLEQRGWSGVLIEPIPELCEKLREKRPRSQVVQAACGPPEHSGMADLFVSPGLARSTLKKDMAKRAKGEDRVEKVKVVTLDEVLDSAKLPQLDFISIDVEGLQYDVLRGFALSVHQPRLLVVEDHLTDLKTHCWLKKNGYRLVKRIVRNNWYIPKDHEFNFPSTLERIMLWRKVYLNTPLRKLRYAIRRIGKRWLGGML
jgi:FkbM family methyltransferase